MKTLVMLMELDLMRIGFVLAVTACLVALIPLLTGAVLIRAKAGMAHNPSVSRRRCCGGASERSRAAS